MCIIYIIYNQNFPEGVWPLFFQFAYTGVQQWAMQNGYIFAECHKKYSINTFMICIVWCTNIDIPFILIPTHRTESVSCANSLQDKKSLRWYLCKNINTNMDIVWKKSLDIDIYIKHSLYNMYMKLILKNCIYGGANGVQDFRYFVLNIYIYRIIRGHG